MQQKRQEMLPGVLGSLVGRSAKMSKKKKKALSCFNPVLLLLQLAVICMSAAATSYMGIISCDLHLFTVKYLTGVGCDRLPGHRSFGLTSSYLPVMRYSRLLLENDQDPTCSNSII